MVPRWTTPRWLIAADVASWTIYREPVWALAADFRAGGGAAIFRLCLQRLGLPADAAFFVDDRADNIEGAARGTFGRCTSTGRELERLRAEIE